MKTILNFKLIAAFGLSFALFSNNGCNSESNTTRSISGKVFYSTDGSEAIAAHVYYFDSEGEQSTTITSLEGSYHFDDVKLPITLNITYIDDTSFVYVSEYGSQPDVFIGF